LYVITLQNAAYRPIELERGASSQRSRADAIAGRAQAKSLQAKPRKTKKNQGRKPWIALDFLGFLRPIRDFATGYGQSKEKIISTPGAPRRPPLTPP
jgi:hypothetical protein